MGWSIKHPRGDEEGRPSLARSNAGQRQGIRTARAKFTQTSLELKHNRHKTTGIKLRSCRQPAREHDPKTQRCDCARVLENKHLPGTLSGASRSNRTIVQSGSSSATRAKICFTVKRGQARPRLEPYLRNQEQYYRQPIQLNGRRTPSFK